MRLAPIAAVSAVLAFALSPIPAAAADPASPAWDTTAIHTQYLEGDFERAIGRIDAALRDKAVRTHDDSVFAFKHLGVMHAASEATRERGKYYMLQLLTIEPTARIMDMYASDMIYMIFRNIQEEFEVTKSKLARAQRLKDGNAAPSAAPQAKPAPAAAAPSGSDPDSHTVRNSLIIGGSVALAVGAGVYAFFAMQDAPDAEIINHEIGK